VWYFDLSAVKVAKKTPFTRQHLTEFFKLLPQRADREPSWTVDIASRRQESQAEANKLRATTAEPKARLKQHHEQPDQLRKAKAKSDAQEPIKQLIATCEHEIREIESKAQAIEDAAFDLKAVNPNAKSTEDTRSSAELIDVIETEGREVLDLLGKLREVVDGLRSRSLRSLDLR
jgi:type I restriction enzyme M protein